jgi:hypothetical protein
VAGCTGAKKEQIPEFRTRKQGYLDHLRDEASDATIRVSLADKVHNARSTVNDLEAEGPGMYARFNSPIADQHWWYRSLAGVYEAHAKGRPRRPGPRRGVSQAGRPDAGTVGLSALLPERQSGCSHGPLTPPDFESEQAANAELTDGLVTAQRS